MNYHVNGYSGSVQGHCYNIVVVNETGTGLGQLHTRKCAVNELSSTIYISHNYSIELQKLKLTSFIQYHFYLLLNDIVVSQ